MFFVPLVFGSASEGTGLAFSNFGGSPIAFTLEFFAPDGSLLAGPVFWDQTTGPGNRKLAPGEQRALTHAEVFSMPADQAVVGWVRVQSDNRDLRVVYQHFTASLDRLDGMNAVERPARKLFLPLVLTQTGTGIDINRTTQTRIAIVNPTETSLPFTISYYRADGTREAEIQRTLGPRAMLDAAAIRSAARRGSNRCGDNRGESGFAGGGPCGLPGSHVDWCADAGLFRLQCLRGRWLRRALVFRPGGAGGQPGDESDALQYGRRPGDCLSFADRR